MYGSSRPLQCSKKSIAKRLDLNSSEAGQFAAKYQIMCIEELAPTSVSDCFRTFGGIDNITQKNRRQDALATGCRLCAREKFGDLIEYLINVVAEIWQVIDPLQLQKSRVRNAFRQLPPAFDIHHR